MKKRINIETDLPKKDFDNQLIKRLKLTEIVKGSSEKDEIGNLHYFILDEVSYCIEYPIGTDMTYSIYPRENVELKGTRSFNEKDILRIESILLKNKNFNIEVIDEIDNEAYEKFMQSLKH